VQKNTYNFKQIIYLLKLRIILLTIQVIIFDCLGFVSSSETFMMEVNINQLLDDQSMAQIVGGDGNGVPFGMIAFYDAHGVWPTKLQNSNHAGEIVGNNGPQPINDGQYNAADNVLKTR
jgi:hypothetical protein